MRCLVVLALVAASLAAPLSDSQYQDYFTAFKAEFGKQYASDAEEAAKFATFKANVDFINQHNEEAAQGLHGFTVGVNQFADLTLDEFRQQHLSTFERTTERNEVLLDETVVQDSVDWRAKGAVTPIKNQGQCGSCWSFSTTGSVEGIHEISSGSLVSLSEQQLVDCSTSYGNQGCNGGLMDYAFKYIIANGGLDTESDYPYTAQDGTCNKAKEAKHAASITGYQDVAQENEAQLLAAATNQPISVAIEADQSAFQFYKSGVFDSPCGHQLDHGVLVVGYGTSTADYWIVKNSWGASWGDQGYIYMKRGVGKAGICGIAMQPSYPTVSGFEPKPAQQSEAAPQTNPTDYGDPASGCRSDEKDVEVEGVTGSFCSPKCVSGNSCPTDLPPNTTAKAECILEMAGSSKPTYCALVCTPGANDGGCPSGATCQPVSVIGICTYAQ